MVVLWNNGNHTGHLYPLLMQFTKTSTVSDQSKRDERIASLILADIYPCLVDKVEKKGHTEDDLIKIIRWLTGFTEKQIEKHRKDRSTYKQFFEKASLNPNASLIKGVVCGIRVEEIENPLTRKARYMDKLIDELARGKKMEKILRKPEA